jgi:cyclophilin family peptidyl-prolyl cis-trans isomerase
MRLAALFLMAAAALAQEAAPALPNGLYAIFSTSMGKITARLYEKDTPISVANFVGLAQGTRPWRDPKTRALVRRPLYDNITFHRVLAGKMIQSGSADGTSTHNCGIAIRDEILPGLRFDRPGKLAMANTGDPDTGGCQFFITTGSVLEWNGKYAIFGTVVDGLEVVNKIGSAPSHGDQPIDPVKLIGVTIERIGPEPVQKPKKK